MNPTDPNNTDDTATVGGTVTADTGTTVAPDAATAPVTSTTAEPMVDPAAASAPPVQQADAVVDTTQMEETTAVADVGMGAAEPAATMTEVDSEDDSGTGAPAGSQTA